MNEKRMICDFILHCGQTLRVNLPYNEALNLAEVWSSYCKLNQLDSRFQEMEANSVQPTEDQIKLRENRIKEIGFYIGERFIGGVGWGIPLDNIAAVNCTREYDPAYERVQREIEASQAELMKRALQDKKREDRFLTDEEKE